VVLDSGVADIGGGGADRRSPVGENRNGAAESDGLSGIWITDGRGPLIRLLSDLTSAIDDAGLLGVENFDAGSFEPRADDVHADSAGSSRCPAGVAHVWEQVERAGETPRVLSPNAPPEPGPGEYTWIRISP
jgi:hypothetical protein